MSVLGSHTHKDKQPTYTHIPIAHLTISKLAWIRVLFGKVLWVNGPQEATLAYKKQTAPTHTHTNRTHILGRLECVTLEPSRKSPLTNLMFVSLSLGCATSGEFWDMVGCFIRSACPVKRVRFYPWGCAVVCLLSRFKDELKRFKRRSVTFGSTWPYCYLTAVHRWDWHPNSKDESNRLYLRQVVCVYVCGVFFIGLWFMYVVNWRNLSNQQSLVVMYCHV